MVAAYLNWGRWVVACPSPLCVGATALDPGAPGAVCLCSDDSVCDHGGPVACLTIIKAEWPVDLEAIIALTAGRPRRNQNWTPGESVQALALENAAHGVAL